MIGCANVSVETLAQKVECHLGMDKLKAVGAFILSNYQIEIKYTVTQVKDFTEFGKA